MLSVGDVYEREQQKVKHTDKWHLVSLCLLALKIQPIEMSQTLLMVYELLLEITNF